MPFIQLHGVVPQGTVPAQNGPIHTLLASSGVTAIISSLPKTVMFEKLQPEEIADWAMKHNAILTAYCVMGPVLPMALGAVFTTKSAVQTKLSEHAEDHCRALKALGDLREFTIQLNTLSGPSFQNRTEPKNEPRTGREFLRARLTSRDQRQDANAHRHNLARDILSDITACAFQVCAAGEPKPDRRLDCVILCYKDQIPRLRQIAQERHEQALLLGLDLVIAGPWPPYSFDLGVAQIGAPMQ